MTDFKGFILWLEGFGIGDVLLPFLLLFTIFYAVLNKSKILGEDKKNLNLVISIILAISPIIAHVTGNLPSGYDPVIVINKAIPYVMLLLTASILLAFLMALVGLNIENYWEKSYSLITLILVNIFIANAYPNIIGFAVIVSVYLIMLSLISGGGKGLFGRPIVMALVAVSMIFHWAITGWNQGLPGWISWLNNSDFQMAVIVILTFYTVISFVIRKNS